MQVGSFKTRRMMLARYVFPKKGRGRQKVIKPETQHFEKETTDRKEARNKACLAKKK